MDVLGWIWWLAQSLIGIIWSVAWFLIGGWVSTLAQIAVIVLVIFGLKYGWRRAPQEALVRLVAFGRFAWAWLRSGEVRPMVPPANASATSGYRRGEPMRRGQPGDVTVNVSTVLSLLVIAGLGILAAMQG